MTDTNPQATSVLPKLEAIKAKRANRHQQAKTSTEPGEPALPADGLPPTGFIRLPQVLKLIPVGRASWWEGIKQGRYPKGHKIGARSTAWRVEDIRDLIARIGAE